MLAPCGVTVRQYSLLLNISRTENCSVKELADVTELDRSTLARSLKPLYQRGLVIDTKEPGTRNSQLELTKAGRKTVEYANQLWTEAQKAVECKLGQTGLHEFEKIMALLEAI
jgi:DNA-binding MarR family transcriptional regulator